jgi:hypothetical protein
LNIPFRDEEHLRQHGFDKTPDIKLEIPFAVDGFIVNWIESKALFGDKEGHNTYFKDQYLSYWNRYGREREKQALKALATCMRNLSTRM